MDFMKWLSSLDEVLFEVMSWLIFFPLTLWRTLSRPLAMMDYADAQLALPEGEQYANALSPPLFLALALLLAHGSSAAMGQADAIVADRHGLAGMVTDDASALVFRMIVFALFPLIMSVRLIRRRRMPIDRPVLRLPFYAQCYPAGAFALMSSLGVAVTKLSFQHVEAAGWALVLVSVIYFITAQTRWFATRLPTSPVRAFGLAMRGFCEAFALLMLIGYLFTR